VNEVLPAGRATDDLAAGDLEHAQQPVVGADHGQAQGFLGVDDAVPLGIEPDRTAEDAFVVDTCSELCRRPRSTASRDHWIVVCPDPGGSRRTWAIDSWGGDAISVVVQLDDNMTLTAPFKVRLPASGLSEGMPLTEIPCGVPMWGYCG
jgi:hypothetical protein